MKGSLESYKLLEFIQENKENFEDSLLNEAFNVKEKIEEILTVGNIDLINNAHLLIQYIIEGREQELQSFAIQEGIAWATHAIPLSFKLEWVQSIRRTLWKFLQKYNEVTNKVLTEEFFSVEKQVNTQVDRFLNGFFITYSQYKDSLIMAQKELVENLSVPIIPITPTISILPLIGAVDLYRTNILEEKVLIEIGKTRIQTLIMDFSGIMKMEPEVIDHLMRIIDGTSLMGCDTVITGLRAEVVKNMISLGMRLNEKAQTLGTLQQALNKYLLS
ncbi:STAS domain-containing protein [Metabacillus idriensis]|uniref:STAS domain-containing protein n=1 Tax=Metabacillus idriensis TaxID=324768 RepID=UPI00203B07BA|nr:STAS domain-containing protein [Metabacillus idriensis]MCM3596048.1 STAS domain-containing protein [Metabacillus idriensis]